jgi:hypothetical protein
MVKVKGDGLFALLLFAIFSFGTYRAVVMDDPFGGPNDVGAAFFPFWVCVFIQILAMLVFTQSVMKAKAEQGDAGSANGASLRKRIFLFVGILLLLFLYIAVMETIGFIASSAIFLVLVHQLLVFSESGKPSAVKEFAISVAFFSAVSVGLYFMFNTVFKLALP